MSSIFKEVASDFLHLFYPNLCFACASRLKKQEEVLCLQCHLSIPQTDFHLQKNNPIEKLFWGRVKVHSATAFLGFSKGGKVQALIHQLKYKKQKQVGIFLGQWMGQKLTQAGLQQNYDLVIPVPLHRKKIRKRGYNQSDLIAEGLSRGLQLPWSPDYLKKASNNESQTRKSRIQRWLNVESIYQVHHEEQLHGKSVLLVDDVVTTGATLEACAHSLLAIDGLQLHIATIACAQQLI